MLKENIKSGEEISQFRVRNKISVGKKVVEQNYQACTRTTSFLNTMEGASARNQTASIQPPLQKG